MKIKPIAAPPNMIGCSPGCRMWSLFSFLPPQFKFLLSLDTQTTNAKK